MWKIKIQWFNVFVKVVIQKLLKSDLVEPGKTEKRLKLQAEHRKNLREFEKKIVTELDDKVKSHLHIMFDIRLKCN